MQLPFASTMAPVLSVQNEPNNMTRCANLQSFFLWVFAVHHPPSKDELDEVQMRYKQSIGHELDVLYAETVSFVGVSFLHFQSTFWPQSDRGNCFSFLLVESST